MASKLDRGCPIHHEYLGSRTLDLAAGTLGVVDREDWIIPDRVDVPVDGLAGDRRYHDVLHARFADDQLTRPELDAISDCERGDECGNADDDSCRRQNGARWVGAEGIR